MGDVRGDEHWLADGESSVRQVDVEPFDIDVATVTNADVARFVADTRICDRGRGLRVLGGVPSRLPWLAR